MEVLLSSQYHCTAGPKCSTVGGSPFQNTWMSKLNYGSAHWLICWR